MKFELMAGKHNAGGNKYVKGDIVTADSDLTKRFLNKFQRRKDLEAPGAAQPAKAAKAPRPAPKDVEEDEEGHQTETTPSSNGETNPLGEDVSGDWPEIDGLGVAVFKDGDLFNISEKGDDVNTALNPKPLTKAKMTAFIKRMKG